MEDDDEWDKMNEIEIQQQKEEKESENTKNDETVQIVRCKMCGEVYPFKNASCPKCGAPNFVKVNGFVFDFLGGVPKDEEIAEDFEPFIVYVDAQMMQFMAQRTVEFYLLKGPVCNGKSLPRLLFVTESSKHLVATLDAATNEE